MCTIDGYVQNTKSIPSDNYLGIAYHHPDGTDTHAFPINIETHAYIDPDQDDNMEWAADPSDNIVLHNSPSSDKDPVSILSTRGKENYTGQQIHQIILFSITLHPTKIQVAAHSIVVRRSRHDCRSNYSTIPYSPALLSCLPIDRCNFTLEEEVHLQRDLAIKNSVLSPLVVYGETSRQGLARRSRR